MTVAKQVLKRQPLAFSTTYTLEFF